MSISSWLLNNLSTAVITILVVGGLMAMAGIGLVAVRRRWPDFAQGEHNDVAGVLVGLVGAIYGIMLAFVVVAVYTSFVEAENTVLAEASQVAQIEMDTQHLEIADAMDRHVGAYVHHVVEDEWPLMATGQSSPLVEADLAAMFATLQGYQPRTQAEISFYNEAIGDLNDVVASRRDRLFAAGQELPQILEILLIGGALLLVAFTWLFGMRRFRAQILMVMGVAALVGFSLVVVLVIDHPFAGEVVVSYAPFQQAELADYWP
jgi:hypothetical protein